MTDYKNLTDYTEDDELTLPVKHKKPINLLRKPSRNRQKIERTRRKNKKKKGTSATADSQSSASGHVGTSPPSTISNSMSLKTQHIEPPSRPTTTSAENDTQNEEPPDTPNINNQSGTSNGVSSLTQRDIVLVPATKEETKIAIDALLTLGRDLNFGIDAEPDDNDILQPIAPGETLPDPTPMVSKINSDDTEILEQHVIPDEEAQQAKPQTKRSDTNLEKRKGQLVIQNYQLVRNCKPK